MYFPASLAYFVFTFVVLSFFSFMHWRGSVATAANRFKLFQQDIRDTFLISCKGSKQNLFFAPLLSLLFPLFFPFKHWPNLHKLPIFYPALISGPK